MTFLSYGKGTKVHVLLLKREVYLYFIDTIHSECSKAYDTILDSRRIVVVRRTLGLVKPCLNQVIIGWGLLRDGDCMVAQGI